MAGKSYSAKQIIGMLREADVRLSQGETVGTICRGLSISEQSYDRWRREYGGLKVTQAAPLKELEKENARLSTAVSNLTLDALILKEVIEGLKVPQRQPKRGRLWLNDGSCVRLRAERAGSVYLSSFFALISGTSAGFRRPRSAAAC